jgi:L-ascorbate metabolism protein UlaG (beta-lactamase superfamily)
VHPPGVHFVDLPPIDLVLVSHNHYDHLDVATLSRLWQRDRPRLVVPLGNAAIITSHDPAITVEAYDWGDRIQVTPELAVRLEPMHHWSARGLFDRNHALWAAFVLETPGGNIYLVGDTGYGGGNNFRQAREKYRLFRLAVLPIGDFDPAWFMADHHMSPEESLLAFADLGSPMIVPIHHRVFPLADTGYAEPLDRLRRALAGSTEAQAKFVPLLPGESREIP